MRAIIRVLVVGPKRPSHNSRGGMATVVGLMLDQHDPRVRVTALASYVDDTAAVRAWTATSGLLRAVALIVGARVDVVHVHLAHRGSVVRKAVPLLVARACGVPAVVHAHSYDFASWFDALPTWGRGLVRRALPAECWLVLGDLLVESYRERFRLPPGAVRALRNPAPPVRPDRSPTAVGAHRSHPVLAIALGRMGQRKGTYDLIEALDLLDPSARAVLHVVLAGDGDLDEVRAEVIERGQADLVDVRGWLDAAERDELLDRADVFLLPSHAEGLPMAMLEAMAAGLAPVVTAVGAVGEVAVDDTNAVLVPPGRPEALAEAIQSMVLDDERRQRLAAAARTTAAGLGVSVWFDDLVDVWTRLDGERRRRRARPPR